MIISHKHRFIFIKIQKTAGTSIELSLARFCGEADVITGFARSPDERLRKDLGVRGPQNVFIPRSQYGLKDWKHSLIDRQPPKFWAHMQAAEVRRRIPREVWDTYYKFCFERHPCEKVLSGYYWVHQQEPRPSITEFLESSECRRLMSFDDYTVDGKLIVDHVARFENLEAELTAIGQRLKLEGSLVPLPRAKASARKDRSDYWDVLSEAELDKIQRMFEREIRMFDYAIRRKDRTKV